MIVRTFGVKGKSSASWLGSHGVLLPELPNTWVARPDGGLVLRLGRSEYLVEGSLAEKLEASWKAGLPDLYRVPRYDAAFVLPARSARNVLAEICALDIRPEAMGNKVLMTLAAGISVTLVCMGDTYCLWCDGTYSDYLQQVLQQLTD